MFNKILAAIDDSETNYSVFQAALNLAQQTGGQLMLVHVLLPEEKNNPVLPTTFVPYYYPMVTEELLKRYQEQWEAAEKHGLDLLRSLTQTAIQAGVPTEFTQHLGNPSRIICDLAQDWVANVIVLGRRGRTGLSEMLLGSVSNFVLHHASCAVLVVQGQVTDDVSAAPSTQNQPTVPV